MTSEDFSLNISIIPSLCCWCEKQLYQNDRNLLLLFI